MKNNRDISIVPLQDDLILTVAADNSGSVGEKREDEVNVPYEVVAYYGARVCVMETLAVGAEPLTFIIHSFNEENVWDSMVQGAHRAFKETGLENIEIIGSTESNFSLKQSASSFTLIGSVKETGLRIGTTLEDTSYAVIGKPLVGEEIITQRDEVLPLRLYQELCQLEGVYELVPVGSKGIGKELSVICEHPHDYGCSLPMDKSAGPSSCVLISYNPKIKNHLMELTGNQIYPIYKKADKNL